MVLMTETGHFRSGKHGGHLVDSDFSVQRMLLCFRCVVKIVCSVIEYMHVFCTGFLSATALYSLSTQQIFCKLFDLKE